MDLRLFHQETLAQLVQDIESNLITYRNGEFSYVLEDETLSFRLDTTATIDLAMLEPVLKYDGNNKSLVERASTDIKFSELVYKAISGLEPSMLEILGYGVTSHIHIF